MAPCVKSQDAHACQTWFHANLLLHANGSNAIRTWWEALPVSSPQGEARNPKQLAETLQGAGPVGGFVFTTGDT